jgi:AcrR family transcriptional regulator
VHSRRRREALVSAAVALLAEGGFAALRHRVVAERAGLPLVTNHQSIARAWTDGRLFEAAGRTRASRERRPTKARALANP